MGRLIYLLYNIFFVRVFIFGLWIASYFSKKLKLRKLEENRCRDECYKKFKKKANEKRILFHCSSLGEWEQAVPVVEAIKKNNQGISVIVSFFSFSGYNFLKDHPDVNGKVYLPLDSYKRAVRFFEIIRPDLWIISAYDIWPNHVLAAKKLNIPIVVISATLAESSGRIKGVSGLLNAFIYKNIQCIYSRSADDTKRFLKIFPFPEKIQTYGDTRADRVYEKSALIRKNDDIKIFKEHIENEVVFIAGSTWPADEKIILPGIIGLINKFEFLKVIIVPHEVDNTHVNTITNILEKNKIESEKYSAIEPGRGTGKRVVIIDTIGILAKIYKNTHIAYIGGSFGKGVHNVLEPAVFGLPVLFGPRHKNSQEAISLKKIGVTYCINGTAEFMEISEKLITDVQFRERCSAKALGYIRNNLGASGKIYHHLTKRFDFIL